MASYTNFPNGITSFGVPVLPGNLFGKDSVAWFVDPVNGAEGNDGKSPSTAFATLYRAQIAAVAGRNDVVYLIGDGSSTGTARLSTALAAAAWAYSDQTTSVPTTGTLTWAKKAVHLIGVCSGGMFSQRARIAPPSGTYTQATFGSGNFITVSAEGCYFANFSVYNGFSTGGTNQIALTVSGARNVFENCTIFGMADAASAQNTGSRSVKLTAGENTFINCTIGGDTVTRTVANASVEIASAAARNAFLGCTFPFQTSAAGVLGFLGTGNGCVDRTTYFKGCTMVNNIKSTSTQMDVFASFTTASPGGLLSFVDCPMIGITEYGDTNGLANSYVNMAAPSASAGGIMVNPS